MEIKVREKKIKLSTNRVCDSHFLLGLNSSKFILFRFIFTLKI